MNAKPSPSLEFSYVVKLPLIFNVIFDCYGNIVNNNGSLVKAGVHENQEQKNSAFYLNPRPWEIFPRNLFWRLSSKNAASRMRIR